ncbi:MAG: acetyl-CoA C-acyltransferase [Chloroflexota bacterium]|nr:acetyl-CoA C-acyltransferase [Chloroflexota bacterium]
MVKQDAYIIDALRTPIGRLGGALSQVRPDDLAALVINALVERTGVDPASIEDVMFGCANQAGEDNRNVARMAGLLAGLPQEVAGSTINRLCASSLDAVQMASRAILVGDGDVFIVGGVESMSRAPYSVPKAERGFAWGNQTMWDTTLGWRYPNPKMEEMFPLESMGETAENIYEWQGQQYEISREEQDRFAYESQIRAKRAMETGRFADEIVPVTIPQRRGEPIVVDQDEHPRPDTSLEKLANLRPAFRPDGTVTAGNASGLNDGAAAVLLMSGREAVRQGLRPMARVVSRAVAGVNPRTMGLGPIPATRKALERAGLEVEDLDLVELNEAFAVQSLACIQELGLDPDLVNVNGGAIALGHPLGCSGARILTTLVHEMKRRPDARYGLATMCVGVGQGAAVIVEKVTDEQWETLQANIE